MFARPCIRLFFILLTLGTMSLRVAQAPLTRLSMLAEVQIEAVTGQVEVWEPEVGAWGPAEVGQTITQGARVRTGNEARAVLYLADGRILRLAPNSTFRLNVPGTGVRDTPGGVASVRG